MGSFVGEVITKDELAITLKDAGGTRKVRTHKKNGEAVIDGPLPSVGDHVRVDYREWKPADGKYTMNFLEFWEPSQQPVGSPESNGGGSSPPTRYVGREPGLNDHWTAARWAISSAIDVLGPGKGVSEYADRAKEFLAASFLLAEDFGRTENTDQAGGVPAGGADEW